MAENSGINKFGNWDGIKRGILGMHKEMERINMRSIKRVALKAERAAVLHMRNQDLGWAPLNDAYLAWKTTNVTAKQAASEATKKDKNGQNRGRRKQARGRYSNKTLIRTSTYMQSITSWAFGNTAYTGVKKTAVHKEPGQKDVILADIAMVHEYGSIARNIPARPLWGPVDKEIKAWVAETNYFAKEVYEGLSEKFKAQ